MTSICLLLSGAALLVAGLGLLGRIPPRDSATFALVIGAVQLVLAVLLALTAHGAPSALRGAAGVFLFGLTYLYVGIDGLRGLGSAALGWFCGLVAVLAVVLSGQALTTDPLVAVLWGSWAVLWALFFVLLALGRAAVARFTGWASVVVGVATTVPPAMLQLLGIWPTGSLAAGIGAGAAVVGFGTPALLAGRPAPGPAAA